MQNITGWFSKCALFGAIASLQFAAATRAFAGPGAVDPTFNVVVNNTVYSVLTQPDGKILIGGAFTSVGGTTRYALARLYPDGTLDAYSLPNNSGGTIYAMLRQPDGKLLIGGNFSFQGSSYHVNVARLNVDGSMDGTFTNSSPNNTIYSLGLQSDGKVLVGGQFNIIGGTNHYYIARLNPDGTIDNSFNAGTISGSSATVNAIAVQSDGNILIGGAFNTFTTYSLERNDIARLLTNGIPDAGYAASASGTVQAVYLQNNGKSMWAGSFGNLGIANRFCIGRLNSDSTVDNGFTSNPGPSSSPVYAVTEDANGNVYVGGAFFKYNNLSHVGVARLFSDGTLDGSFNNNNSNSIVSQIRCLALQNDGKVLAGGTFTQFNGTQRTNLVRFYGDTYPAEIVNQPKSLNAAVGSSATFSVDVSNPTPVSYQWMKNGVNIPGATDAQYSIFNVQFADAGSYRVFANSALGGTTSSNAVLQVGIPPSITQQPQSQQWLIGSNAYFSVQAAGDPVLKYQWYHSNAPVAGATNASLALSSVQLAASGPYQVIVTNIFGAATSSTATLIVGSLPQSLQYVLVPSNHTFSLQMPGTPGFNYVLQTTTNVSPPVTWQNIATNPADSSGNWSFSDTNFTTSPARFYRISSP